MKLEKLCDGVYNIVFDTQYELTSTMLRVQEYYESPYEEIRGKYFELQDFIDLYSKDHDGFTYYTDWSGFNVPAWVVKDFFTFPSFSKKELALKALVDTIEDGDYYLIASSKESGSNVHNHELAHAFFYLSETYRNHMRRLVRTFNGSKDMRDDLASMGYCKEVMTDEIQAYLATSSLLDFNGWKFIQNKPDIEHMIKFQSFFRDFNILKAIT